MNFPFDHYCPQLFYLNKGSTGAPAPLATGVLINAGGYFLVTATHVFEEKFIDEVVILTADNAAVRLYGDLGFYLPLQGKDPIDIAVLRLDENLVRHLSIRYQFLHYKNIALSGVDDEIVQFVIFGFIAHQTELNGKEFNSEPFAMVTVKKNIPASESGKLSNEEHLLLSYNRRKQSFIDSYSRNIGPRDLSGLSGGGVWAVTSAAKDNKPAILQLAGILIEQRTDRGFIVASRIQMVTGILYHRFGIILP